MVRRRREQTNRLVFAVMVSVGPIRLLSSGLALRFPRLELTALSRAARGRSIRSDSLAPWVLCGEYFDIAESHSGAVLLPGNGATRAGLAQVPHGAGWEF